jgi:hypothetical protein
MFRFDPKTQHDPNDATWMNITNKNSFARLRHALLIALIGGATGYVGSLLAAGEEEAVTIAAKKYVAANSVVVSGFRVWRPKIHGDYARLKVTPKNPSEADPVWVFLKREKGVWRGLDMGSSFSPEDYNELHIPLRLRLQL